MPFANSDGLVVVVEGAFTERFPFEEQMRASIHGMIHRTALLEHAVCSFLGLGILPPYCEFLVKQENTRFKFAIPNGYDRCNVAR